MVTDPLTGNRFIHMPDGTVYKFAPEGRMPTPEEWFSEEEGG